MLPYFVRSERNQRGASPFHGNSGPQSVSDVGEPHELATAFIAACGQAGIPGTEDFNGAQQEGAGYYQLITWKGRRCSSAVGYLKPARQRGNLTVETDAPACRVMIENGAATGVVYRQHGQEVVVRARREVVLSAGAIQSPQLLMLSGIGDPDELGRHGIPLTTCRSA